MVTAPRFLSCDWGTSTLRLRWVDSSSAAVIAEQESDMGIKRTHAAWQAAGGDRVEFYAGVLAPLIAELEREAAATIRDAWLVVSGMASSSLGMVELPYASLPFPLDGSRAVLHTVHGALPRELRILLVSGVRAATDVIRGEEAQIVGLRAGGAELPRAGTFILPGTHSKHLSVVDDAVVDFRTFMTGEMFDTIVNHTILRSSTEAGEPGEEEWAAFADGVRAGRHEALLHSLFTVRAAALLGQREPLAGFWYLSGLLIGAELHSLAATPQEEIVLCADGRLGELYATALRVLGHEDRTTVVPHDLVRRSAVLGHRTVLSSVSAGAAAAPSVPIRAGRR